MTQDKRKSNLRWDIIVGKTSIKALIFSFLKKFLGKIGCVELHVMQRGNYESSPSINWSSYTKLGMLNLQQMAWSVRDNGKAMNLAIYSRSSCLQALIKRRNFKDLTRRNNHLCRHFLSTIIKRYLQQSKQSHKYRDAISPSINTQHHRMNTSTKSQIQRHWNMLLNWMTPLLS